MNRILLSIFRFAEVMYYLYIMQSRPFSYLFSFSYFGARYKGWAPQPNQPTVQRRVERVLGHVLGHTDFSMIGASRTDSGVSCREGYFQLFLRKEAEMENISARLNGFLPEDIRIHKVAEVPFSFNLIKSVTEKTYRYYFSNDPDFHPFASALLTMVQLELDLSHMDEAAKQFEGKHDFWTFCKPSPQKTIYERELIQAKVCRSKESFGPIPPKDVYYFEVTGRGFLHHQVRKMMTAIWEVGSGNWQAKDIQERLDQPRKDWEQIPPAPANGLILWETRLT